MKQPDVDTEVKDTDDAELDEVLTAADLEDPDSDDLGDAVVEDPNNAPKKTEKETPSDASTEEKPAEEEDPAEGEDDKSELPVGDDSQGGEPDPKKPKEVPGETPREKALRLEVTRIKQKLRTERGDKMFKGVDIPVADNPALTEDDQKLLESYDQEQLNSLDKVIGVLAKKHGFVKKDEFSKQTYQGESQKTLDTWLETHPIYDEKNDPDGVLWKRFQEEFSQYKAPKNPRDFEKIFNRIHRDIVGIETDGKGLKQVEAQQEKIKVASHGAANAGGSKPKSKAAVGEDLKQLASSGALQGFSPEELKDMGLE